MIHDAGLIEERLRRITGLEPVVRETRQGWVISAIDLSDNRCIIICEEDAATAVKWFLDENLRQITSMKMREQRGRCARCGRRGILQLHHKVFRSQFRDDRPENLELIDEDCHGEIHQPRLPLELWERGL